MQKIAVFLYALAYLVLFGTWAFIVDKRVAGADALVHFIETALNWLTAHVLTVIYPGAIPPAAPPTAVLASRPFSAQSGHAAPGMLTGVAMASLTLLSACSLLPANFSHVEEGAAQSVVQSSERTICRDIPIGTWMRLYGTSADRIKGWQSLCFNPVTAPLDDATVAAIQKVYPTFQQTVDAGGALPASSVAPALPVKSGESK